MTLAARLAHTSKAPVFFMFMERLSKGVGYSLHLKRVPDTIYSDDMLIAVSTMNKMVEDNVRHYPAQHEWLYRRFWDRPQGEKDLYKTQKNYPK